MRKMRSGISVLSLSLLFALTGTLCAEEPSPRTPPGGEGHKEAPASAEAKPAIEEPLDDEQLAEKLELQVRELREKASQKKFPNLPARHSSTATLAELAPDSSAPHEGDDPLHEAEGKRRVFLPGTLLWLPPIANPLEPRMYVKETTLEHPDMEQVNDFALGGTLPLNRWSPWGVCDEGIQLDIFAVAISRFSAHDVMVAVDYRVGLPLTFAWGRWTGKLAFEHVSTHLGDEFIEDTGADSRSSRKEEIVMGLGYYLYDDLRIYGQWGHALSQGTFVEDAEPERLSCGIEWCERHYTAQYGRPFAAVDLEVRGDQEYTPNVTVQLGWQWRGCSDQPALRVCAEFYDGRSPYGQFADRHESWLAFCVAFDH